ncbi:helix-turn-helix domain-containing protein [Altericroceibacterium spongiae]|nr:AraC family transcriptional regulator [Altericroceibacterium spongiae]
MPVWSFTSQTAMTVSGGMIANPPAARMEERCHRGLKLVVLLQGALTCEIPIQGLCDIKGPSLCAILDRDGHMAAQSFDAGQALHYVIVTIEQDAMHGLIGADMDRFFRDTAIRSRTEPVLFHSAAPRFLQSIARQMLRPRLRQPGAHLYATGKALELSGLAMDHIFRPHISDKPSAIWSADDMERLHFARDLLFERLDAAPDMATLARRSGLNIRKLTHGFRDVFGATPGALLKAERLEQAHHMIASGTWSVSQAAWQVGYTPAAFATAFRRRFGVAPSTLRP